MKFFKVAPLLFTVLILNLVAAEKPKAPRQKTKSRIRVTLAAILEAKQSDNLDRLSNIEVFDRAGFTTEMKADLTLTTKIRKAKVKSKTQLSYLRLENNLYEGLDIVNRDDLNEQKRRVNIAQEMGISFKFNKNFSLKSALDYEKTSGYFLVTELQILPNGSISEDKRYNILNSKSEKVGAVFSSRLKLSKKVTLLGIYKFNEFFNTAQYTFAGDQGTNDRRINSAGALLRFKATKKLRLSLNAQATQTEYKNRLTTLENGGFNQNGLVDRAKYMDTKAGFGLSYSVFQLDIDQAERQDISNGGDGHKSTEIRVGLSHNLDRFSISGDLKGTVRTFSTQSGTKDSNKRQDEIHSAKLNLGYQISKKLKAKASIVRSKSQSNNVFGENENQIIGLKVTSKF